MPSVLLCITSELIRTGLRAVLDGAPDLDVVAEAVDRGEVGSLLRRARPAVVLAEYPVQFLEVVRVLGDTGSLRRTPVVVLVGTGRPDDVERVVRAGVRGVVQHSDGSHHVLAAIRAAAAGQAYLAPSVTAPLLDRLAERLPVSDAASRQQLDSLTSREREVLRLVASGLTTAQVADALRLSRATVKSHVSHLLGKLGLQERAQAVAFAYRVGVVDADSGRG